MKNVIYVFVLCLISFLGCKTSGTNSNNGNPNPNTKEQTLKVSDPKEELLKALEKLKEVPFVTETSSSSGDEADPTIEQYSAVNSGFSRKSKDGAEMIIIGSETFSKMNSNWEWGKENESKSTASEVFFFKYDWLIRHVPNYDEIKSGGEETVNGKPATVYNLALDKPHPEVPSLIRIWVGKDNGLPLKIVNNIPEGGVLTRTLDYESAVKIERPTIGKKINERHTP